MQDVVNALIPQGTKRIFKKGSVLLYQGEAPSTAYIIKNGNVKAYTINEAGEEQIVTVHGKGDIFPSPWIFKKTSTSLYYYETISTCDIVTVTREALMQVVADPQFQPRIIDYLALNYIGMLLRATALQQSRASEKIMFTLYYLIFRFGRETKPGLYTIDLPLTHGAIASLVGLTRETTTTELNKLKLDGILSYTRHVYVVHKAKLEHLLGEESFADIMP